MANVEARLAIPHPRDGLPQGLADVTQIDPGHDDDLAAPAIQKTARALAPVAS